MIKKIDSFADLVNQLQEKGIDCKCLIEEVKNHMELLKKIKKEKEEKKASSYMKDLTTSWVYICGIIKGLSIGGFVDSYVICTIFNELYEVKKDEKKAV